MPLYKLGNITLKNLLPDSISKTKVQYAESNKSFNNWYNFTRVNVETSENVAWTEFVTYNESIPNNNTVAVNANNICFGGNNGFWQVYFKYKGKDYKLSYPNWQFDLKPLDDNQILTITFSFKKSIKINFQSKSNSTCFPVIEGTAMTADIQVQLESHVKGTIDNIAVAYCETSSSSKSPDDNSYRLISLTFGSYELNMNDRKCSETLIPFTYHRRHQHWQVRFSYNDYFYEIRTSSEPWVNFDLDTSHHGSDLEITIDYELNETFRVTFQIDSSKKIFEASKSVLKSEQMDALEKKSKQITRVESLRDFTRKMTDLVSALKGLQNIAYMNADLIPNINDEHMFLPSPELDSDTILMKDSNINIETSILGREREVIVDAMENVSNLLDNLQTLWIGISKSNEELKLMAQYFENKIKRSVNNSDYHFLKSVFHNLDLYDSMLITVIMCEFIKLVAFNKLGMSFRFNNFEQSFEITIELKNLASILENELKLWKQQVKIDSANNSNNSYLTNLADESITPLEPLEIRNICITSLKKSSELFEIVREQLIANLKRVSDEIHLNNFNVNISMTTSASVGIVGGILTIVGIALEPFTFGASTGLIIAGIATGVTGGLAGIGTSIADSVLTQNSLKSTLDLTLLDKKLCSSMTCLQNVINENILINGSIIPSHFSQFENKNTKECIGNGITNAGAIVVKSGVGLTLVRCGMHVAKLAVLRTGLAAAAVVFDSVTLVFKAVNLSKGGKAELGYKLEKEALDLEKELRAVKEELRSIENEH